MNLDHTRTVYFTMLDCKVIHTWSDGYYTTHTIEYRSNDDMYATIVHNKEDFYRKWLW